MILFVYRIVTAALYWLISPYGIMRAKEDEFWQGRLGNIRSSGDRPIWIHAASAGEVRIASYLASYLRDNRPEVSLVGTVQTRTGFEVARTIYPDSMTVAAAPLDAVRSVRRALKQTNPSAIVIAETEIWFTFLAEAFRLNIPVVLINGRMTEKGFSRYRLIRRSVASLLCRYNRLFLKSKEDSDRYSYFDVAVDRRVISGDMKFDAPVRPRSEGRIAEIRSRLHLSDSDFLLVAGSTRPGEEELLFQLFKSIAKQRKNFKLVIAPRHIDRAEAIIKAAELADLPLDVYGQAGTGAACLLVDQFGLLEELYMAANLAFVGGSLVEIGGHNLLEPVWGGTPVVFGPSLFNVVESAEYIMDNNFGTRVNSIEELNAVVLKVIDGETVFARKEERSQVKSPTAMAGDYILELTNDV
ncbi:MAG: glycosyltransferase N-terminal domain-containing protein [bacterium]|nr:glycosyltransferase N-terminal domain-containing protein [bacterium]